MKAFETAVGVLALCAVSLTSPGCSNTPKAPDIASNIRSSLNEKGLKDVSVKQDRNNGVITLSGHVPTLPEKMQAETVAKALAGPQVVANEIAVIPAGQEHEVKTVNADLDKGIENNLHAALVQNRLSDGVKYEVHNGVVTLKGNVDSEAKRGDVARLAGSVPFVQQVVNEMQVKNQRATSSN